MEDSNDVMSSCKPTPKYDNYVRPRGRNRRGSVHGARMFWTLELRSWRQFGTVDIEFHPRLTILTGANGSGKTTLLQLLARHWGWDPQYAGTPVVDDQGKKSYSSDVRGEDPCGFGDSPGISSLTHKGVGFVHYRTGEQARIYVPLKVSGQYQPGFVKEPPSKSGVRQTVCCPGVFIPSHRRPYSIRSVHWLPTALSTPTAYYNHFLEQQKLYHYQPAQGKAVESPNVQIKTALIALAISGHGNTVMTADKEAKKIYDGFVDVLRKILPTSLGFKGFHFRLPEVVLDTETGDVPFDAVSGGVAALIDLAWQVYIFAQGRNDFVVAIDEPETHLHPELQRTLLPNLLDAFPACQFVIATHNPLVVTSVRESYVYVLEYNEERRVDSKFLQLADRAGGADETLTRVLGVEHTIPVWAARKLEEIVGRFVKRPFDVASAEQLEGELKDAGLVGMLPTTMARVAESHN